MFLVTNINDGGFKRFSNLFYRGSSVREQNGNLVVAQSVDSHGDFDDKLASFEIGSDELNSFDATFVIGKSKANEKNILFQTDLIGFEPCFYFSKNGKFVVSSDPNSLLEFLNSHGYSLSLSTSKVRDLLYWGVNFNGDTVVPEIKRIGASTIVEIDNETGALNIRQQNKLSSSEKIKDPKVAAKQLYDVIDQRFKSKVSPNKTYGLGLSGGLDSRVAAYFAKKHNAKIKPYFIGDMKGAFGLNTYDAKRSMEVDQALSMPQVNFINPLGLSWNEKIANDLKNATFISSNAHINAGYDFADFDVILNGAMGGELFGACVPADAEKMSVDELAQYLLNYVVLLPKEKYPNNIVAKVLYKKGVMKDILTVPSEMYEELMPKSQLEEVKGQMKAWILDLKKNGYTNAKIVQADIYLRYARSHYYGYFYALNGTKKVLPVYLAPSVIKLMMNWDSSLFVGKKVQVELLKLLPGLAEIRSQTVDPAVADADKGFVHRTVVGLERVVRGGGMNYRKWVQQGDFDNLEQSCANFSKELHLSSEYWRNAPILRLTAVKMSALKEKYHLVVKN